MCPAPASHPCMSSPCQLFCLPVSGRPAVYVTPSCHPVRLPVSCRPAVYVPELGRAVCLPVSYRPAVLVALLASPLRATSPPAPTLAPDLSPVAPLPSQDHEPPPSCSQCRRGHSCVPPSTSLQWASKFCTWQMKKATLNRPLNPGKNMAG